MASKSLLALGKKALKSVLKPFTGSSGATAPGAGPMGSLNDMWEAEKKRRQLAEQKHVQELNKKGGNFPAGGSGRMGGISA